MIVYEEILENQARHLCMRSYLRNDDACVYPASGFGADSQLVQRTAGDHRITLAGIGL